SVLTTTVCYLALTPGFATVGNAALFSGRSGPMVQLAYRPAPNLAVSSSAAWLRGGPGVPDRTVTSLLANYRPTRNIGLVGEVRNVDDTVAGVRTTSTSAQAALTFTSGRWGLVLAGSQLSNENVSLGVTGTTTTLSARAGYTVLNGLPLWGEVARSFGDTTSWAYGVGWTFHARSALDLHVQLRHKIYTLPSAYDESSLELGVLRPLASGAQLTLGGGLRYVSASAAASPYLALQYGYPVYAYGPSKTGRLAAVMFVDRNGNGLRDPDEPGVGGVILRVNDKTAAMSDQDGSASVSGVLAGDVSATLDEVTVPAHLVALRPSQTVRVSATRTAQVAFALAPAAAITGLVFVDENNNGLRDAGERTITGAVLRLLGTDVFRTSDADGSFVFAHIAPGDYTLVVDQRALLNGYKVRGEGTYVIGVQAGGTMAIAIPLLEGKTIIRTFP
ncbi:MAG: MSCRAMM family protein, partial [bacterium]